MTLGDTHKVYGKLAAVGIIEGEEYYWFVDKNGTVAMMPAVVIDAEPPLDCGTKEGR